MTPGRARGRPADAGEAALQADERIRDYRPDCWTTRSITTDDARTTSTVNTTTRSTTNPIA